tara:strand:+ start:1280 stop:1537 length:258 start_codon:yes stop_codon:yes gene_type:complete
MLEALRVSCCFLELTPYKKAVVLAPSEVGEHEAEILKGLVLADIPLFGPMLIIVIYAPFLAGRGGNGVPILAVTFASFVDAIKML